MLSPAISRRLAGGCKPHSGTASSSPCWRRSLCVGAHWQALRIGKQLIRSGDHWVLDIPAEDVKTKRPLDYPLSPELSRRIDIYVNEIRPRTAGADTHDYLWASSRGAAAPGAAHLQRRAAAHPQGVGFSDQSASVPSRRGHAVVVRDPANVRGAKDLLGHASFATTEKYYIMAQSRLAGRALARTIDSLKRGKTAR